ncbi:hypothetical protein KI387_035727, partial [Taxus chinensis]
MHVITPHQNGVMERQYKTIMDMACCMVDSRNVPYHYWAKGVNIAVYILNQSPAQAVWNATTEAAWSRNTADVADKTRIGSAPDNGTQFVTAETCIGYTSDDGTHLPKSFPLGLNLQTLTSLNVLSIDAFVKPGIGHMEFLPVLFDSISHSIDDLSNEAEYNCTNCYNLFAPLKLLKPFIDHVRDSNIPFTEAAIQSFQALYTVLNKAKELVMRYGPNCSRIYMAIRGPRFIEKFEEISSDISRVLSALPLVSLHISEQLLKSVELCIKELRRVRCTFQSYDERTAEAIENALRDLREKSTVCHSKIKIIADKLDLLTNQEVLREACALEMEKGFILTEESEQEEECINLVIDLVTQMRDYMLELKQTQSQYGPPIPADFRCPLSLELMADPVIIASGQTYERAYIQQWLDQGMKTCPKTRQTLNHTCLIPNYTVKALIENWCKSNNVSFPKPEKVLFHNPQSSDPSQFGPEKHHSDDGISIKLNADEHEHEHEKEKICENFSSEIIQEESTLALKSISLIDGEQVVATSDTITTDNPPEQSQEHDQTVSPAVFPLPLDDVQLVIAEDADVLGKNGIVRECFSSCSNDSRQLRSNLATVGPQHSTSEIEEIGSPSTDYNSSQSYQPDNPNSVTGGMSSPVSDIWDNVSALQLQVKKLVENLQANSIEVQIEAVTELRFLAKNDPGSRITITKCGAIRPLVEMLHSSDLTIQENAVTTLLNLSLYEKNHKAIPAAGAIDSLVYVLKTGNPQARENAAATLYSISAVEENKKKIAQSGGIPPLVDLLVNGSNRGKKDAATALFKLSTYHDNKVRIVRAGAVKPLVEAMDPAAGMVDKAVAALSNLATIREGRVEIGKEGGISHLVEVVELGSQRGKENAAAALWQLCSNSNRFRTTVLKEGAIPPLVALSKSGTPRAKEKAELLLRHFREQRRTDPERGADRHIDQHFGHS